MSCWGRSPKASQRYIKSAISNKRGLSINILIDNKFEITSGQFQFIFQGKIAKSGKNAGKEWLDNVGFYPTIGKLVSALVLHNILTGEARQCSELEKQVEQLGQKCLEAFTANGR